MNTPTSLNNCEVCQSWSGIHHTIPYTLGPNYSYHNIKRYVDLINHKRINNTVQLNIICQFQSPCSKASLLIESIIYKTIRIVN